MLLYQYPPKSDKRTKQLLEFHAAGERKKLKKEAFKNIVIALSVILLTFFIDNIAVKIFTLAVSAFFVFLAYVICTSAKQYNNNNDWTRIYDDKIEHSQNCFASQKVMEFTVKYSDIESTHQDWLGRLIINLKEDHTVKAAVKKRDTIKALKIKKNCISLSFNNTQPKLYLIKEMSEKIKYPKKEYISYKDYEDDWDDFDKKKD